MTDDTLNPDGALNTAGTLYGVGVGPGDPELITVKALKTIAACEVAAFPDPGSGRTLAFEIVRLAMPEIDAKEQLPLSLPMTRDREQLQLSQREAAERIVQCLQSGKNVAFLTLGDPSIYSTYTYLHRLVDKRGYKTKIIPGVPSFCAAAASLGEDLVNDEEALHIIPAASDEREAILHMRGTRVLMKMGKSIDDIRGMLREREGRKAVSAVANCGLENERVWKSIDDMETGENPGYFTLIVIKDRES